MKKNVIIEIPKGSNIKYEIEDGKLKVDRILFGAAVYPHNYGYFENTLDWDGDPLDALVISDHSFPPGTEVPTRILGAMKMIDGGETDTKLIAVIDVDPRFKEIKKLEDVEKHVLDEIQDFFENYKNLQKKEVKVGGFKNVEYAAKQLEITQKLYNQYKDIDKSSFISKMKEENPDKYE